MNIGKIHAFTTSQPDIEQYTPPEIVMAANRTLGSIDLDPATTTLCNNTFIRANVYYTKENSGLDHVWKGRAILNPPGGEKDLCRKFWEKLGEEFKAGNVTAAVYVAYNIEQLQQSQRWSGQCMLKFPFCIPRKRIVFYTELKGELVPRDYAAMSNAIIYLGKSISKFKKEFSNIGSVIIPRPT